ncbi:MAG: hypothetical protein P9F75_19065 [Candidatus Contendobacter sp.]|nr:hypothetical protein [Candidatus Contendobacter sp.]
MTWYKNRISRLIVGMEGELPYRHWNSDLFANVKEIQVPGNLDRVLTDVAVTIGTWERVVDTARLWSDEKTLNAVNHGYVLTMMFFCLQYPRETILSSLRDSLPINTSEKHLCASLMDTDSDYRHIRNSIAHGCFAITGDGKAIDFSDRNWRKQKSLAEVELDSLIVFDILMSAYGAKIAMLAEQGAPLDADSAALHPRQ